MTVAYANVPSRSLLGTGSTIYAPPVLYPEEFKADINRTHIISSSIDPVLKDVLETFQSALVHQLAGMVARVSVWSQRQPAHDIYNSSPPAWERSKQHWLANVYVSSVIGRTIVTNPDANALALTVTPSWGYYATTAIAHSAVTGLDWITSEVAGDITALGSSATSNELALARSPGTDTLFISASPVSTIFSSPPVAVNIDEAIEWQTIDRPYAPLAVTAVEDISDWFGIPAADVFKATGIAKRTYHEWKRTGTRRPRSSSEGRLWELHQIAAELVETMGLVGVRHWINQDPMRLQLLQLGEIDKLASQAYAAVAITDNRPAWVGAGSPEIRVAPRRTRILDPMDPSDVVEPDL